ncbi:protein arv1 homolog isoform X4 [Arachis ipaensis]|uniref:protein arv1 homolog isoform X4 n=1 Tax=Arachis ipaensis TaxID=130454 RepID=UPI000A2B6030|nr:protein arv1 homolog isoform X4 [Arachis ipaensis]XP_025653822.1 protein arv1 homolog isoform X3 [Arachis hypogaea]
MGYQCVRCSFPIKSLYVQYSPGNIRLMKCEKCKAVADEYIECEIMILMIDLMLHKQKAYRHLLYNVLNQQTLKFEGLHWKLAIIYFIFDACIHSYVEARNSSSLVSTCCKVHTYVFMYVVFGNFMFLLTFFIMVKIFLNASINISRFNDLLLTIMISYYFKIFLIAMMVWEFPTSVIFIIELFCLSSNAVALNAYRFLSCMSTLLWKMMSEYEKHA